MKIKYIADYKFSIRFGIDGPEVFAEKVPVACVVADDEGNFGVSVCCNHEDCGDRFSKIRAKEVAIGRLQIGSTVDVPKRKITNRFGQKVSLISEVNFWVEKFTGEGLTVA